MVIAAQILGIIAVSLYLLSYQLKKRSHIIWTTFTSNTLYFVQYLLLGAFSGAIMDVLSTFASFFAAKKNSRSFKRHAKFFIVLIELVIAVVGVTIAFLQNSFIELLPIGGALFQTCALWFENEQTIRKFSLGSAPFWLVYNTLTKAYSSAIGSIFAMVSIIISLIRYRKSKTKKPT